MMNIHELDIQPGELYQHYKTKTVYEVLELGLQEHSLEPCIIYKALSNDSTVWVRNVSSWIETVDVAGKQVPRFKKKSR